MGRSRGGHSDAITPRVSVRTALRSRRLPVERTGRQSPPQTEFRNRSRSRPLCARESLSEALLCEPANAIPARATRGLFSKPHARSFIRAATTDVSHAELNPRSALLLRTPSRAAHCSTIAPRIPADRDAVRAVRPHPRGRERDTSEAAITNHVPATRARIEPASEVINSLRQRDRDNLGPSAGSTLGGPRRAALQTLERYLTA